MEKHKRKELNILPQGYIQQSDPANFMNQDRHGNDIFEEIPELQNIDNIEQLPITFDWTPEEKYRAKLYQLDGEGRWQDLGTGYFSIQYKETESCYAMSLIQEVANQQDSMDKSQQDLLENEVIEANISFHRQRETIITWSDKENSRDLAVSFQNNQGALYTWEKIC